MNKIVEMDEEIKKRKIELAKKKVAVHSKRRQKKTASSHAKSPPMESSVMEEAHENTEVMLPTVETNLDCSSSENFQDLLLLYKQKAVDLNEALIKRDAYIKELTLKLEETMAANSAIRSEDSLSADVLAREIRELSENMSQQSSRVELNSQQLRASQNRVLALESSCLEKDNFILELSAKIQNLTNQLNHEPQVPADVIGDSLPEARYSSAISQCIKEEVVSIDCQVQTDLIYEMMNSIPQKCGTVDQGIQSTHELNVEIQDLMEERNQLRTRLNELESLLQPSIIHSPNSSVLESTHLSRNSIDYKLKRIDCLNTISKLIQASLYARFPLNLSIAKCDVPKLSGHKNNESLIAATSESPAEVSMDSENVSRFLTPVNISLEILRGQELSEGLPNLKEFLEELTAWVCVDDQSSSAIAGDQSVVGSHSTESLDGEQEVWRKKQCLEHHLQSISELEQELQGVKSSNPSMPYNMQEIEFEQPLLNETLPSSCISLVSFVESEQGESNEFTEAVHQAQTSPGSEHLSTPLDTIPEETTSRDPSFEEPFDSKYKQYILELKDHYESEKSTLEQRVQEFQSQLQHLEEEKLIHEQKYTAEKNELVRKIELLDAKVRQLNAKVMDITTEKVDSERALRDQIVELVEDHNKDLEALKENLTNSFNKKQKVVAQEYVSTINKIEAAHLEEMCELENSKVQCIEAEKQTISIQHENEISSLKNEHLAEIENYRRRVDNLHLEKCELLNATKQKFESIVKRNHVALKNLCNQIQLKVLNGKEKMSDCLSGSSNEIVKETWDSISQKAQEAFNVFNSMKCLSENASEDEHLSFERLLPEEQLVERSVLEHISEIQEKHKAEIARLSEHYSKELEEARSTFTRESESEQIKQVIMVQMEKLKDDYNKQLFTYQEQNERMSEELQLLNDKMASLESSNFKLKDQLRDKNEEKESDRNITGLDTSVSHAAQNNSRLLHVLSDLVKTFLDIESEINTRLKEFGLSGTRSDTVHTDDDTGQSAGSREDFTTISVGESPNLDLAEDGPDLTPRAWDLFHTDGCYDAEIEGEDVVIGASRRLRSAVDYVLQLLSIVFDKDNHQQEHKALLKRNEELVHKLQSSNEDREHLQLRLSVSGNYAVDEYQKVADEAFHLAQEKETLEKLVKTLKEKVSQLEYEKEIVFEEKRHLKEQCQLLGSRLADPEKRLMEQYSKLSSEKVAIEKSLMKDRQNLLSRVQQLEMRVDEVIAEKEEIMEKRHKDVEDLNAQIEAMEKQLQSTKKFIDEQVYEREQEREDYYREIRKLSDAVKDKDKIQSMGEQLSKETESLEMQLAAKTEEQNELEAKVEKLEQELHQAMDKNHDLKDIVVELEKQLEMKSHIEAQLKENLNTVTNSLVVHEKNNTELKTQLEECSTASLMKDSLEQLQDLEEQLASKNQELQQMSQSDTLLKELRGQIHFLESTVDHRVRQLEALHFESLAVSPVLSDDASHSDLDSHHMSCAEGWEMSPRSVHWLEIQRLENNINRLMSMEEELIKQNKDLFAQVKKFISEEGEWTDEKDSLQQQVTEQLLQISILKSHIEEQRHKPVPVQNVDTPDVQNLKGLLKDQENQFLSVQKELEVTQAKLHRAELEKEAKTKAIESLKDHIQQQQWNLRKPVSKLEKDCQTEYDTSPNEGQWHACMSLLLNEKNEQIKEFELQMQAAERKDAVLSEKNLEIENLSEELKVLQEEQLAKGAHLTKVVEENNTLTIRIRALEEMNETCNNQLQLQQKQLEDDFATVHDMMQKKDAELCSLQEETENQTRLEAEVRGLKRSLKMSIDQEEELCNKIGHLQQDYDRTKLAHEKEFKEWQKNYDELKRKLSADTKLLSDQISLLKKNLTEDSEDIDISEVRNKIVEAASVAKDDKGNDLFKQLVFTILKQAINAKVTHLNKTHQEDTESIKISWQLKLEKDTLTLRNSLESQFQETINNLRLKHLKNRDLAKKNFEDEMTKRIAINDKQWQDKWQEIEMSLKTEEAAKEEEYSKKVTEIQKALVEGHSEQVAMLNIKIETILKEQKLDEEKFQHQLKENSDSLKSLHEKEKAILTKDFEKNFFHNTEKIRNEFCKQIQDVEASYGKQINDLEQLVEKLEEESRALSKRQQDMESENRHFREMEQTYQQQIVNLKDLNEKLGEEKQLQQNRMEDMTMFYQEAIEKMRVSEDDNMKNMCKNLEQQIIDNQKQIMSSHHLELQNLKNLLKSKFDEEKRAILLLKEKEICEMLRNHAEEMKRVQAQEQQKISEIEEIWKEKIATAERVLNINFMTELSTARKQFSEKLKAEAKSHQQELEKKEQQHCSEMMKVNTLWKAMKDATSLGTHSETSSHGHLSSDANLSTDETCSSCLDDMIPDNRKSLLKKLQKDGAQIASMFEAHQRHKLQCILELHNLQEERLWVLERLKSVVPKVFQDASKPEMKVVIEKLVQEMEKMRRVISTLNKERVKLSEKNRKLMLEINFERKETESKLKEQRIKYAEVDSALMATKAQLRQLKTAQRINSPESDGHIHSDGASSTHSEIELAREASVPKSLRSFSYQFPTINSTLNSQQKITDAPLTPKNRSYNFVNGVGSGQLKFNEEIDTGKECKVISPNIDPDDDMKWKMSLVKVIAPVDNTENRSHKGNVLRQLEWKYKRSQSFLKALVFQKTYLLHLLAGFQTTEDVTLAILNMMNLSIGNTKQATSEPSCCRPCSRFRSAAYVIIAVSRMRFMVAKWRFVHCMPTSHQNFDSETVSPEKPIFLECPRQSQHSTISLSSLGNFTQNRQEYNIPDLVEGSQLSQFVSRLETLQHKLGLDEA